MSHIENKAKLNGNHILVNIQNRIKILDGHLKQVHKTYLTFFPFFCIMPIMLTIEFMLCLKKTKVVKLK